MYFGVGFSNSEIFFILDWFFLYIKIDINWKIIILKFFFLLLLVCIVWIFMWCVKLSVYKLWYLVERFVIMGRL